MKIIKKNRLVLLGGVLILNGLLLLTCQVLLFSLIISESPNETIQMILPYILFHSEVSVLTWSLPNLIIDILIILILIVCGVSCTLGKKSTLYFLMVFHLFLMLQISTEIFVWRLSYCIDLIFGVTIDHFFFGIDIISALVALICWRVLNEMKKQFGENEDVVSFYET